MEMQPLAVAMQLLLSPRCGPFYGRAQTQNDGRTPRKLVDKDRNTVGEMRMRVGRGGQYRFIRVARAFYGSESRSSFGAGPRLRAPLHAPPPPSAPPPRPARKELATAKRGGGRSDRKPQQSDRNATYSPMVAYM